MSHYEERLERDLAKIRKRIQRMGAAVVGATAVTVATVFSRPQLR